MSVEDAALWSVRHMDEAALDKVATRVSEAVFARITAAFRRMAAHDADHLRRIADLFDRAAAEGKPSDALLATLTKFLREHADAIAPRLN
jgi:hypothetical protein